VDFLTRKLPGDAPASARGVVVLVHGLWMTGAVCAVQRAQLARLGYRSVAFSYASTRVSLQQISTLLAAFVSDLHEPGVHFIAHSLGGLVVLDMLAAQPDLPVGRTVLLATPCAGSRVAQHLSRWKAGRALIGSALLEWDVERVAHVTQQFEVGMIAGTLPLGMGRLFVKLPAPHDGAVCVEETRLPGLRDHLTLPVSHSGMLVSTRVTREACNFLEHASFSHG
jgi:pimeloyl-ACP methyl ester carboxylesterase